MTKRATLSFAIAVLIALAVSGDTTSAQQPVWQIHASWCRNDQHSSGNAFRAARNNGRDYYDAVILCQQDARNPGAVAAVQAAGHAAVNAYMGGGVTPPLQSQVWVIGRWDCRFSDGTSAGDVTWKAPGATCGAAHQEMTRFLRTNGGDACFAADQSKWQASGPKWIQTGACQVAGQ